MKNKILLTAILSCLCHLAFGQENKYVVTKNKLSGTGNLPSGVKAPDAEFQIKSNQLNQVVPDLVIPTYSTAQIRVVDIRSSQERIEVAIQVDEFGVHYYDYKLEAGKWVLKLKKHVCRLNGSLAGALAQVDILEGGIVDLKFDVEKSSSGKSGWNMELTNKDHKDNVGLYTERYTLAEGEFVLSGMPVKFRPKASVSPKIEKQNKIPQDNK